MGIWYVKLIVLKATVYANTVEFPSFKSFMENYKAGLHIIATISARSGVLDDMGLCRDTFNTLITRLQLNKVGEVYHQFTGGGYTATVCLTESHISIHTWPEFGKATFDVFLSNNMGENSDKARTIFMNTVAAFEGDIIEKLEIFR